MMGLGVMALWIFSPATVRAFDYWMIKSYTSKWDKKLKDIESLIKSGDEGKALKQVTAYLIDLDRVQYEQRLSPYKQKAFRVKHELLVNANQVDKARENLEELTKFAHHDIDAMVLLGSFLYRNFLNAPDTENYIIKLYTLASKYLPVQNLYFEMLVSKKQIAKVFQEFEHLLKQSLLPECTLEWRTQDGSLKRSVLNIQWLDGHKMFARFLMSDRQVTSLKIMFPDQTIPLKIEEGELLIIDNLNETHYPWSPINEIKWERAIPDNSLLEWRFSGFLCPPCPKPILNYIRSPQNHVLKAKLIAGPHSKSYREVLQ